MKPLHFLILIIFYSNLPAQWELQNPYPTPNNINKVYFVDENIGWIVGDNGTILKTEDGGVSWGKQEANTEYDLNAAYFFDSYNGFVGGLRKLLKTTNGGETWEEVLDRSYTIIKIMFLDELIGFYLTEDDLYKTIDGGSSWKQIDIDSQIDGFLSYVYDIDFVDPLNGWLVSGHRLLETTDQGESWTEIKSVPDTSFYTFVRGIDSNSFWVGGTASQYSGGDVYLSEDGGNTFSLKDEKSITNLAVINDSSAVGIGKNNTIKVTHNRGETWIREPIYDWYDFYDAFFINSNVGWVVGENGLIYKTNDSGNSWEKSSLGTNDPKLALHFTSENFGCVVGYDHIIKTIDGGENWQVNDFEYFKGFDSIFFIDSLYGWASETFFVDLRSGKYIYKTTDGGITWNKQDGPQLIRDIFFINRNIGWAVGGFEDYDPSHGGWSEYYGFFYKTTDGGNNWIKYEKTYSNILTSVYFIDSLRGWIGSKENYPMISLRTTDGGETWIESEFQEDVNSIVFVDSQRGFAAGRGIFYTVDGGITWNEGIINQLYPIELNSIYFTSSQIGWSVGNGGTVLKSTDRGLEWSPIDLGTNLALYDIQFVNDQVGWICGDNGLIMKTTNGGVTFVEEENLSVKNNFVLEQNYPNPFNSTTTINFSVPKASLIKISVYNVLGQLVKTISNKHYLVGNYNLDIDANSLSSGVYFYRLESKEQIITKKFVLMK